MCGMSRWFVDRAADRPSAGFLHVVTARSDTDKITEENILYRRLTANSKAGLRSMEVLSHLTDRRSTRHDSTGFLSVCVKWLDVV